MAGRSLVELLGLADMLLVEELKGTVEERMGGALDRNNMVQFIMAGEAYNGARIRREAREFVMANIKWGGEGWRKELEGQAQKDLLIKVLESAQ